MTDMLVGSTAWLGSEFHLKKLRITFKVSIRKFMKYLLLTLPLTSFVNDGSSRIVLVHVPELQERNSYPNIFSKATPPKDRAWSRMRTQTGSDLAVI